MITIAKRSDFGQSWRKHGSLNFGILNLLGEELKSAGEVKDHCVMKRHIKGYEPCVA
jgi:hypothetical protein